MFNDREFAIELIDFYGALLTEHQRCILNDYYMDDFTMQEIAENYAISKSAVSDLIKRCLHQLKDYEDKLELLKIAKERNAILDEMQMSENQLLITYADKLKELE